MLDIVDCYELICVCADSMQNIKNNLGGRSLFIQIKSLASQFLFGMQDNRSAENAVYEATDAELVTGTWYNPTEAGA